MKTLGLIFKIIAGFLGASTLLCIGVIIGLDVEKKSIPSPPEYLYINGETWLVQEALMPAFDGLTNCDKRTIYYSQDITVQSQLKEVLWHEATHAMFCKVPDAEKVWWGRYVDGPEHLCAYEDGAMLPQFIRSNPEFIKWEME